MGAKLCSRCALAANPNLEDLTIDCNRTIGERAFSLRAMDSFSKDMFHSLASEALSLSLLSSEALQLGLPCSSLGCSARRTLLIGLSSSCLANDSHFLSPLSSKAFLLGLSRGGLGRLARKPLLLGLPPGGLRRDASLRTEHQLH